MPRGQAAVRLRQSLEVAEQAWVGYHAEMSIATSPQQRAQPQPLPENIRSVQPGGGVCYRLELAWGRWRRWYLRHFRPRYVERMASLRQGDAAGAPHPLLDPRDLKYCRNLCTAYWAPEHDPFRWRERIPLARWGLAEVLLMAGPSAALAAILACTRFWPAAPLPAALALLVVWFFRDPARRVPEQPGLYLAPADGKVTDVTHFQHDEFLGGPAVRVGIFLSLFNVHVNRAPCQARVIALRYAPGKFLSALNPACATENESMWLGLEEEAPPHRRLAVRQISGLVARRIVCQARPGEVLLPGEKFGMIKLGSRTELWLPAADELEILVRPGDRVRAGQTPLARIRPQPLTPPAPSDTG